MTTEWQPDCSLETLKLRAWLLTEIRQFFYSKAVMEVETPLLGSAIGTDPQLDFFTTDLELRPLKKTLYLQTSPEFAMKRLLAAGSGCIFQICKAFRNGESGRFHNPEFTLLEWYRVGFTLDLLMDEIAELMTFLFKTCDFFKTVQRVSYADIFFHYTGLNAVEFSYNDYCAYAVSVQLPEAVSLCGNDHALWLDFLFSHKVQSELGHRGLSLVYGFPACLSSLARINAHNPLITDRVELFIKGIELGNGYYELIDPDEQNRRFEQELSIRARNSLAVTDKDTRLLAALTAGLPECSGIAIGLDRLLMLLANESSIDKVLSFSIHTA